MSNLFKTYTGLIEELPQNGIFVFGANTEGRHGAGAAKVALEKFGAVYGQVGYRGRSYGIVTKDLNAAVHPSISRKEIIEQIKELYKEAQSVHFNTKDFYIAYSGTGFNLNHYTPQDMADMFRNSGPIPSNIIFEEDFNRMVRN